MAAGYIANIIASHIYDVSTHSHAKAAEDGFYVNDRCEDVSTHSRAKAAELMPTKLTNDVTVSTHSRAKAAEPKGSSQYNLPLRFNTQPREGG